MAITAEQIRKAQAAKGSKGSDYVWDDGKVHSITFSSHKKNVAAKAQARQDAAYDYTTPLAPDAFKTNVQSAMDLKYRQPLADANTAVTDSVQRVNVDIPAWYKQYTDALAESRKASSAEYQNAATAAGAAAPTPTGDPTADNAAKVRADMQNSFANLLRNTGTATTTNLDNQIGNSPLMELGSKTQELKNQGTLKTNLQNLQLERGDYGNTYAMNLRNNEQGYATNLAAADAATLAAGGKIDAAATAADAKRDPKTGLTYGEEKTMSRQEILDATKAWTNNTHRPPAPKAPPDTGPSPKYYNHTKTEYDAATPAQRNKWKKQMESGTGGKAGDTPAGIRAEKNRVAGIRKTSGDKLGRSQQASNAYDVYQGQEFDPDGPEKNVNGTKTGTKPPLSGQAKRDRDRQQVLTKFTPEELAVGRAIKRGGVWDQEAIDAAHKLGIRIPRKYLPGYADYPHT